MDEKRDGFYTLWLTKACLSWCRDLVEPFLWDTCGGEHNPQVNLGRAGLAT
jgi:hypothetical protein